MMALFVLGNHSKKPSDRRDPLTQTPTQSNRKNMQGKNQRATTNMGFDASYLRSCAFSLGRQPKDTHFNNNNSNKRPAHVGMNGFNGAEVSGFLNQRNCGDRVQPLSTDAFCLL
jgi:hypothetical protein